MAKQMFFFQHPFNDTYSMLYVQWSGFDNSDTIVVISRDTRRKNTRPSYLYVSNNYGKSFVNQSKKLEYKIKGVKRYARIQNV